MALSLLLPLGGCGIFDEKVPEASRERVAPGTEKVTDDWSCIADQKGRWDCFQSPLANATTSTPAPTGGEEIVEPNSAASAGAQELEEVSEDSEIEGAEPGDDLRDQQTNESYIQSNQDWQKLSAKAFVLQVAAHTSRSNAETALTGLDAPGAEIVKTWSEKGDVFAIIAGSYPDRSEAEAAAEAFTERNQGTSYWIRSTAHLLKAL